MSLCSSDRIELYDGGYIITTKVANESNIVIQQISCRFYQLIMIDWRKIGIKGCGFGGVDRM